MLYDARWSYYGEFAVLGIWGIILVLARRMIFGKLSKNALLDGGEKSRMIRAMTLKFEKSYEVHVEISDIPVFVKKYLCQERRCGVRLLRWKRLPERWMDVYETKNKRSGAYSCGSAYRTTPYVLLNHKNTYDGLSTLCHEMGHAMHSFYSNKTQPATKARYKIFVAEVASTCNEILLSEYLRKKYADNEQAQIALIGSLLQHFRTTVFRQTMFAEFEYKAHCMAESGESLTRDSLSAMYYDLNKLYYGGACKVDKEVAYEWMRIPHFYNSFYVYKYATSFCAAVALSRGILSGDKEKIAAYRRFLTLGGSMPPIEELKTAGVDMSTPQPVCDALDYFAELIMQYQNLLNDEG